MDNRSQVSHNQQQGAKMHTPHTQGPHGYIVTGSAPWRSFELHLHQIAKSDSRRLRSLDSLYDSGLEQILLAAQFSEVLERDVKNY